MFTVHFNTMQVLLSYAICACLSSSLLFSSVLMTSANGQSHSHISIELCCVWCALMMNIYTDVDVRNRVSIRCAAASSGPIETRALFTVAVQSQQ